MGTQQENGDKTDPQFIYNQKFDAVQVEKWRTLFLTEDKEQTIDALQIICHIDTVCFAAFYSWSFSFLTKPNKITQIALSLVEYIIYRFESNCI